MINNNNNMNLSLSTFNSNTDINHDIDTNDTNDTNDTTTNNNNDNNHITIGFIIIHNVHDRPPASASTTTSW